MMEFVPITIAVAVVIIFVADRILTGLKSKGIDLPNMQKQLDDLHTWHNRTDEEGVPVWYVRKSLENAIGVLADNSQRQTQLLEKMNDNSESFRKYLVEHMGE